MTIKPRAQRVLPHCYRIDRELWDFLTFEVIQPIGIGEPEYWERFTEIFADFHLRNDALLARRDALARWVSLYDAVYASDIIESPAANQRYDLGRGEHVVAFVKAALTTIQDCDDIPIVSPNGHLLTLRSRSLILVRNVGLHMATTAVSTSDEQLVAEGILDAIVTCTIAIFDLDRLGRHTNSHTGSIYVVKPKLPEPEKIPFVDDLFGAVERLLGLDPHTIKLGLIDEKRRTTLHLGECIRACRRRVTFINTGFLDRTGDESHTLMHAGPVVPKSEMKNAPGSPPTKPRTSIPGSPPECTKQGRSTKGCVPNQRRLLICTPRKAPTRKPARTVPGAPRPQQPQSTSCTTTSQT